MIDEPERAPVVGVVGGSGGVGASTFAATLAAATSGAVLIDLDVDGGGLDVLLGIERAAGARWSGLRVAGGSLDPDVLRSGLCGWSGTAVLAADVASLDRGAVSQVLEVAAGSGPVVLDLPRRDCAERDVAVAHCDLVVIVARADVAGMVAAHAVATGLRAARVPLGAVIRRDELGPDEAARLIGVELLGALPPMRGRRGVDPARPPRATGRLAVGVLRGAQRRAA